MVAAGYVYKAVTSQLSEMDEMDIPNMEWNIFDEDFLSTQDVIDILRESEIPSMEKLAEDLEDICEREYALENDEDEV